MSGNSTHSINCDWYIISVWMGVGGGGVELERVGSCYLLHTFIYFILSLIDFSSVASSVLQFAVGTDSTQLMSQRPWHHSVFSYSNGVTKTMTSFCVQLLNWCHKDHDIILCSVTQLMSQRPWHHSVFSLAPLLPPPPPPPPPQTDKPYTVILIFIEEK